MRDSNCRCCRRPAVGEQQSTGLLHLTIRILITSSAQKKKSHTIWCGFLFWQRMRDSNPRKRSQSPVCYRYTNPLSHGTFIIIRTMRKKSSTFFQNSKNFLGRSAVSISGSKLLIPPRGKAFLSVRSRGCNGRSLPHLHPGAWSAGSRFPSEAGGASNSFPGWYQNR